jgi:hypothetical protein
VTIRFPLLAEEGFLFPLLPVVRQKVGVADADVGWHSLVSSGGAIEQVPHRAQRQPAPLSPITATATPTIKAPRATLRYAELADRSSGVPSKSAGVEHRNSLDARTIITKHQGESEMSQYAQGRPIAGSGISSHT